MGQIFDIINIPLGYIIRICYELTNNYLLALILFSFALQILLLPFAIKQQKNSIKQAKLDPKVKAIRKKYAGRNDQATQQKMNQEVMDLYKTENFNPMGGCLPLLIQMPILLAIFNVVRSPLTYIKGYGSDVIDQIKVHVFNLMKASEYSDKVADYTAETITKIDEINVIKFCDLIDFGSLNIMKTTTVGEVSEEVVDFVMTAADLPNFSIGGINLAYSPSEMWNPLIAITILTLVFTLLSQWITKKVSYNPNPEQQKDMSMKIMTWSMPLLSVFIAHQYAAAIGLYWIIRNVYSTIQTVILAKVMPIPRFTEEEYKAAEKEVGVKASKKEKKQNGEKKKVRSLHRIDEEDDEETTAPTVEKKADPEPKDDANEKDVPKLKDESDRKTKKETNGK